jgi:glycosyltransferase involved in cell wall biosynthesis
VNGGRGSARDGAPHPVGLVVEQLRRRVPGGIGTYAAALLGGLSQITERPEVELVTSRARADDPLASLGYRLHPSRLPGALARRAWPRGLDAISGLSLLHATSFDVPPTRAPLVVTVHDLLWREFPEAYSAHGRAWHDRALQRVARRASVVVVPSRRSADALIAADTGIAAGAIEVIEEGADHLPPPDHAAAGALLQRWSIEGPYLLCVGTLEPRKNLRRVLEAYASVREELDGQPALVVCGPSGWGEEGAAQGSHPGVHLAGRVSDELLAGLYARAGALVYAPLGEGFGLPVIEAMTAGIPVLSSPVPAAGGATELVDPLSVPSIADGLRRIWGDQSLRDDLVARGSERVAGLSWARCAERHVELWRRVLHA